jgi:hypothetical protein
MIELGEAAIAWRGGLLSQGAELAASAFRSFADPASSCERSLVGALAAACDGSLVEETRGIFVAHAETLAPVGLAAQAAALLADATEPALVPGALRDRALAWAKAAVLPDYRREVLTPREVIARLVPGVSEFRAERQEMNR